MDHWTNIQSKLENKRSLDANLHRWRLLDNRIIFTNGCFDIIHKGHIELLAKAKSLGGKLVIGINSDESVSRLKGENRPIKSMEERASILASLCVVDAVIEFEDDTPLELIEWIQPDYLVKGGDWEKNRIVGADIVERIGGSVVTIPLVEGFSTTLLEEKIIKNNKIGTA